MKNFTLLLLFIGFIFTSCKKNDLANEKSIAKSAYLIQNDESRELFKKRVAMVMGITDDFEFSLTEITTNEIYSKTGSQVYKVNCYIPGLADNCFIIKKDKTSVLYNAAYLNKFKDTDFDHMMVTDLNNDSIYEYLVISTDTGSESGDRFALRIYWPDKDNTSNHWSGPREFLSSPSYTLSMEKESDQVLFIRYKDDRNDLRLGQVIDKGTGDYDIKLSSDFPEDLKEKLDIKNW